MTLSILSSTYIEQSLFNVSKYLLSACMSASISLCSPGSPGRPPAWRGLPGWRPPVQGGVHRRAGGEVRDEVQPAVPHHHGQQVRDCLRE